MEFEEAIRVAAHAADSAVSAVMRDYRTGLLPQEEAITGALLGRLAAAIETLNTPGLSWSAGVLTNKGPGTEARRFGADFIPNCDTMKKARAWLESHGVAYDFHDYKKAGIDRSRLETWSKKVGWETLLNRAGTTFRNLPDADKQDERAQGD